MRTIVYRNHDHWKERDASIAHNRQGMYIPQLPVLDPELMRIWDTSWPTKVQEHVDCTERFVDNIPPIHQSHPARDADVAAVIGRPVARIDASFQPVTGGTPRNHDALVVEEVEV